MDDDRSRSSCWPACRSSAACCNLPFPDRLKTLEHWLEPVVEAGEAHLTVATGVKVVLARRSPPPARCVGIARRASRSTCGAASSEQPGRARDPRATAGTYDASIAAFVGGPGREAFDAVAWFDRTSSTAPSTASPALVRGIGAGLRRLQTGYVRNYALGVAVGAIVARRASSPSGARSCERPARAAEGASPGLPAPHRHGRPARPSARSSTALVSRRRPELARLVGLAVLGRHRRPHRRRSSSPFETGDAGFQFVEKTTWIADLGISWHLGVDGISLFLVVLTGVLFPIAILGAPAAPRRQAVLRLAPAARGRLPRRVPRARPLPVLRVLRDRARADVLPHRRAGATPNRRYAAMKFFLYTMFGSAFMLVGLVAHRRPARQGPGGDLTFDLVEIAERPGRDRHHHRPLAVPRLRHRVRRQGAAVPAAHLAARRPHRGADGRLGDPGRRHAEARHLRVPALRPLPVPRGVGLLRPAAWSPSASIGIIYGADRAPPCRRT